MEKVKPVLVLALIAAVISGLVIVVYMLTFVDTTNVVTDKQAAALVNIYGGTKDDYTVVPVEEWEPLLAQSTDPTAGNVQKVFKKNDGSLAIECVVKGYKNGFDLMVGVNDSKVEGVAVVSVGEETPGLGTKTNDAAWLGNFKGIAGTAEIVKTAPAADNQVQAITSATYSSRGVATAVNTALSAYEFLSSLGSQGGEAA